MSAEGSRFEDVWSALRGDAYHELPESRIRFRDVARLDTLRRIYASARRTLSSRADMLPYFDKLVHPVGICLRGVWRISEPTAYSGYFAQGKEALIIARASDNMGETRPQRLRFLGLAGKLYPTVDADHAEPLQTADFVLNENVVGSHTRHFAHATLSSDLLPIRFHTDPRIKIPMGILVASVFALADMAPGMPHPMRRQLYPVAQLGESLATEPRAPAVMLLRGLPTNPSVHSPDFREELSSALRVAPLRFAILVSDRRSYLRRRDFRAIGEVSFSHGVASCSCDHRLHFSHAPNRNQRKT
jgi:hypothetical protein